MRILAGIIICSFLFSCSTNNRPDVSGIKVTLKLERFEKSLFNMDTVHFAESMTRLVREYPGFAPVYFTRILNLDPHWPSDTTAGYIKGFLTSYRPLYDSAESLFPNFKDEMNEIEQGLRYVKYYFPKYRIPHKVITYIGPVDGYGDIITDSALVVGLQQHMGADFSMYQMDWVQQIYADYITRRFAPEYIPVNAIKNIVNDMYPESGEDKSLIVKMVENGKKLYCMQQLLPDVDEYLIIGYTKLQLEKSYDGEAQIWNLFIQNNLLQSVDYNLIKNYVGESPKTQELGDGSPGNIGSFTGWQIVKKFAAANSKISLKELMDTPAETIFREAKYKP